MSLKPKNAPQPSLDQDSGDFHCSAEQAHLWLRGLISMAWVDGDFDDHEQQLITELIRSEWPDEANRELTPISAAELGRLLEPEHAEDFLRTAVMTAVADGVYTAAEDQLLHEFAQALNLEIAALDALRSTLSDPGPDIAPVPRPFAEVSGRAAPVDPLHPLREWMDGIDIKNRKVAHFLCRLIPAQCPFERDVVVFGRKVVHIPAMCKLNPLYDQVVGLRFRALSYLADQCGEDVTPYVQ